ncbi:MAG: YdcF family protein [Bacteroidales bacterium]|nr:YdcF family protein [Bacteroidales bacterium]
MSSFLSKNWFILVLGLITVVAFNSLMYNFIAYHRVTNDLKQTPCNQTGLLLGTSRLMNNGDTNLFFTTRCKAAYRLWKNGKIKRLVISGDSTNAQYDEVQWMREGLTRMGMPDSVLILDKHGYNTMASLRFCKDSLQTKKLTLISQQFHNVRAIVLAQRMGMDAIGYNATPVTTWYGWKTIVREFGARIKSTLLILFERNN